MTPLDPGVYLDLVRRALAEDVGYGDRTTNAIVPAEATARARFEARGKCVVAGLDVATAVFTELDRSAVLTGIVRDGDVCQAGKVLAIVTGSARALLTGERTALNFLQRLSGIATLTRRFVEAADGNITVLDTRKTTPGLRALEKYAVRCGGGTNHRFGLYDAVLIKDNHIRIAGSVAEAVGRVLRDSAGGLHAPVPVEVEAQSLAQVEEAIAAGADTIMLDNLGVDAMREAVRLIAGRTRIEISGGVTLETLPHLASIGADVVSVGALTHSAPAVDISLEIEIDGQRPAG
jgi:nicotinate-nucleotide pyrophosphorylase (carboxylating)